MATCDVCGKEVNMPYHCKLCGGTFCAEHRLPEAHDCPGLDDWGDDQRVFDSGFETSVETDTSSDGLTDRLGLDTGVGGPLAYFRGNMTFLFLGLMWLTFFFQYIVFPYLLGISVPGRFESSPAWEAAFVLSPDHLEYVWTWVTSVFAHGGFGHIAINSIVIYFFGRLVEDYIGSRAFAVLFLVSGVLAGLGQILVGTLVLDSAAGVLGASGAGLAIMGVLTVLNPSLRVYLYFIFPIPLWVLTIFYVAISVLGILGTSAVMGGGVANVAHLVGLVIGLAYGQHVKDRIRVPNQFQFGGGPGGPGGPRGPGGPGGRGPF